MDEAKKDYKKLITQVIKKQMVVLGPEITLAKARSVKGLKVDEDGSVLEITGAPQEIIQNLVNQFIQLSGLIMQKTMEPILDDYPQDPNAKVVLNNLKEQIQPKPSENNKTNI